MPCSAEVAIYRLMRLDVGRSPSLGRYLARADDALIILDGLAIVERHVRDMGLGATLVDSHSYALRAAVREVEHALISYRCALSNISPLAIHKGLHGKSLDTLTTAYILLQK